MPPTQEPMEADHLLAPEQPEGLFGAASVEQEVEFYDMLRRIAQGEEDVDVPEDAEGDDGPLQLSSAGWVISRAAWGARPPKAGYSSISSRSALFHYNGPALGNFTHDRCEHLVRGIQKYHMDSNGWNDIAYSDIVCPHGYVFVGRGQGNRTAANGTNDANSKHHAICGLLGVGDDFGDDFKRAYLRAMDHLNCTEDGNHSDVRATSCPGDAVRNWQQAGSPTPGTPRPKPTPTPTPTGGLKGTGHLKKIYPVLQVGDKGAAVKRLQTELGIQADGIFGPITRSAVLNLQRRKGLAIDGIAGPQVWSWLLPVLDYKDRDPVVQHIKKELGITASTSRYFGKVVVSRTKRFQKHHGLKQTGVWNRPTMRAALK